MSYESRIYIVKQSIGCDYAQEIAKFNCSAMPYEFKSIFDKTFAGKLYADDGNTLIEKDKYGEHLKYADFPTVIAWLEKEVESDDFRRIKPLLALLKGFDLTQWQDGEMKIVHYGY